jgi:hypothetical protein
MTGKALIGTEDFKDVVHASHTLDFQRKRVRRILEDGPH